MFATETTYHVEKMMQYRQAEMNKKARSGVYISDLAPQRSAETVHSKNQRSLWRKWF